MPAPTQSARVSEADARTAVSHAPKPSRLMARVGWVITGIVLLFLLADGVSKVMLAVPVVEATLKMGYPEELVRPLGLILLGCGILYAIPRTAILGAILLTAFLGGAVASHLRLQDPLFSHVLFGAYVGILAWVGLYFRDARLRALLPVGCRASASRAAIARG
jgi:hypothetical protein